MSRTIELIVVLTLLIFSFFAGVKYSDSIKNHASWIFEAKEEDVELPDLSNEAIQEISAPAMDSNDADFSVDQAATNKAMEEPEPTDNVEGTPAPATATAPAQ